MKNILITGGAGFIGSHLALELVEKGYNVTVFDNLSSQIHGINPAETSPLFRSIKDKVKLIIGSVTNKEDWKRAIEDQDTIVHLAAETGTGQSMYMIEKYVDVNIKGTSILLDLLINTKHRISKILIASSRAIYGEGKYLCVEDGEVFPEQRQDKKLKKGYYECSCPVCGGDVELLATSEDSKIHPNSIYGITEQCQEQLVIAAGESAGIPIAVLRYQNVYGEGQSLLNSYTGILSIFATRLKNNNHISVFEDGLESRDFIHIDDVVKATILALELQTNENIVINVGTGSKTTVLAVAEKLRSELKSNVSINITGNYRVGDIRHNYADLTRAKNVLNFTPKITFSEGIKNFCEWVNRQGVPSDTFTDSISELKSRKMFR